MILFAKPHVYVTLEPQKFFLQKVVKTHINIRTMVKDLKSLDSFQPTRKQLNTLPYIDAYFTFNLEVEKKYFDTFQQQNYDMQFIDMTKDLYGRDIPNIWLDPLYIKGVANNILESVIKLDPINEEIYRRNCNIFLDELDLLYIDVKYLLRSSGTKNFFVFDDSLQPFFDRFDLQSTKIDFNKSFMTTLEKRQWQKIVKENNIKTILIVNSKNLNKARIIANAVNIPILNINTLSYNWLANIHNIANELAK